MPDEAKELLARLGVPVSADEGPKYERPSRINWRGHLLSIKPSTLEELRRKYGKKE